MRIARANSVDQKRCGFVQLRNTNWDRCSALIAGPLGEHHEVARLMPGDAEKLIGAERLWNKDTVTATLVARSHWTTIAAKFSPVKTY